MQHRRLSIQTAQAELNTTSRGMGSLEELKVQAAKKTTEINEKVQQKGELVKQLKMIAGGRGEASLWTKRVSGLWRELELDKLVI